MDFIRAVRPHQATFVPDTVGQFTSDHGWNLPADAPVLKPLIDECHALGVRVSLFMDPLPEPWPMRAALGADRVELYTESWAAAWGTPAGRGRGPFRGRRPGRAGRRPGRQRRPRPQPRQPGRLPALVPGVQEVSIGHALIADALELGYDATVRAYLACIRQVQPRA
jgi:pyridoxine 5-phosphate synthase